MADFPKKFNRRRPMGLGSYEIDRTIKTGDVICDYLPGASTWFPRNKKLSPESVYNVIEQFVIMHYIDGEYGLIVVNDDKSKMFMIKANLEDIPAIMEFIFEQEKCDTIASIAVNHKTKFYIVTVPELNGDMTSGQYTAQEGGLKKLESKA